MQRPALKTDLVPDLVPDAEMVVAGLRQHATTASGASAGDADGALDR